MEVISYASFLTCPYRYFGESFSCWKSAVQHTINDIVHSYLRTPCSHRTNLEKLKIICEHWSKLDQNLFDSKQHYILISAKVTDHLLYLLKSVNNEKNQVYKTEIFSLMSIPNEIHLQRDGWIFEKILLEVDEDVLDTYWSIFKLYCSSCESPPQQIELVDLLNAKRYVHYPNSLETDTRL